ncbi:unnamed protein product [Lampetra planeri]
MQLSTAAPGGGVAAQEPRQPSETPPAADVPTVEATRSLPTILPAESGMVKGASTPAAHEGVMSCSRWTEEEALPTALNDDVLAAFRAIPEKDRATLQWAYVHIAAIFDPPSNARRRFLQQSRCLFPMWPAGPHCKRMLDRHQDIEDTFEALRPADHRSSSPIGKSRHIGHLASATISRI